MNLSKLPHHVHNLFLLPFFLFLPFYINPNNDPQTVGYLDFYPKGYTPIYIQLGWWIVGFTGVKNHIYNYLEDHDF